MLFLDIGCGVVAMLPIEHISVSRIHHSNQRFQEGQKILAAVYRIDPENRRITMSHREPLGTWMENASRFQPGETVRGIVRSIKPYGSFIELSPNLSGLADSREDLEVGDEVSVFIKNIRPERMKVKLQVIEKLPLTESIPRSLIRSPTESWTAGLTLLRAVKKSWRQCLLPLDLLPICPSRLLGLVVSVLIIDDILQGIRQILLPNPVPGEIVWIEVALLPLLTRGVRVDVLKPREHPRCGRPSRLPRRRQSQPRYCWTSAPWQAAQRLGPGQLCLRQAQLHSRVHTGFDNDNRLGISHANILTGGTQQPPTGGDQISCLQKAGQVMQRRVRVAAPEGLHQRRGQIIHGVAAPGHSA